MHKIKITTLVLSLVISGNMLFAQSIDEGKKFMYYEKYKSAKDVFSKLVSANPNNIDAVYWLGQAQLNLEDTASAKAITSSFLLKSACRQMICDEGKACCHCNCRKSKNGQQHETMFRSRDERQ